MKYLHIPGPTAVCVTILVDFCKTTCIYCAGFCAGFCAGLCAVAMLHRRRIAVASPSHRRIASLHEMLIYGLRVHQRCPPPTFLCCDTSCHGSRISQESQDRPGRLKLGPIALPRALYRVHWSVLKLKGYFHCSGASKMALLLNFQYAVIWWRMDKNCNTSAKFVCH